MDQNEQSPPPDYIKGFNEGYLISRHNPGLAEKLSSIEAASERLNGFKDGRLEYMRDMEREREHEPAWVKRGINSFDDPERDVIRDDIDRGKD